jgi:spermidine/putrescine transport system ATP-binding protein
LSTSQAAIEAVGVSKVFQSTGQDSMKALDNVSVAIRENEFFTLLGPSGCGKTTLLRLIAGFDFPTDGAIKLYGENIADLPPYKRPVNTVFQNYALFPHMTVAQNIGFGLEMLGKPKDEIAARVSEMLKLVQMESMKDRKTSQISGGQQQRVALARALAPRPKVLLLDEPLSALDYKLRKEMQIELKRLQLETGITFIFVTHDQEEALTMSDRIAVMSKGRILQVGGPHDIYDRPADRFVADFIGETNFLKADIEKISKGVAHVKLADGGQLQASIPEGLNSTGKITIVVRPEHAQLTKPVKSSVLKGTLENVVYFGTDTHFHVKLVGGDTFIVRQQNSQGVDHSFKVHDAVGIAVSPGTAQVLRD